MTWHYTTLEPIQYSILNYAIWSYLIPLSAPSTPFHSIPLVQMFHPFAAWIRGAQSKVWTTSTECASIDAMDCSMIDMRMHATGVIVGRCRWGNKETRKEERKKERKEKEKKKKGRKEGVVRINLILTIPHFPSLPSLLSTSPHNSLTSDWLSPPLFILQYSLQYLYYTLWSSSRSVS